MVCVREKGFCKDLLLNEKCPLRKGQNEGMALCVSQPHTILSSLLHLCSVVDLNFFFYIVGQNKCCACTFFLKSSPYVLF